MPALVLSCPVRRVDVPSGPLPCLPMKLKPTPERRWLNWLSLALMAALAIASVRASAIMRDHADERRAIMDDIAEIETLATRQSGIVWRALTVLLVEDRMAFGRLRGEEQRGREELYAKIEALRGREAKGERLNRFLGYEPTPTWEEELDFAARRFISGVQGTMGQMSLSHDRIRRRLDHWDMNHGAFEEALAKLKGRDEEVAVAAADVANRVNVLKALLTLLATCTFVLRIGLMKRRREAELQGERLRSVAASEARFREIVQNSSDLIMVAEGDGRVRYASPSSDVLVQSVQAAGDSGEVEECGAAALDAARSLELAIEAGALDTAEGAIEEATGSIETLLGHSLDTMVAAGGPVEVAVAGPDGTPRVFDVRARDLREHGDVRGIVLNGRDVTERKALEQELRHQALHDPLTGLPNRRRFAEHFATLTDEQRRASAVLFVDLDGFKLVNDSYGHGAGDELLTAVAHRIGSCLRYGDLLARQGGDEFLILFGGDALPFAESIQEALRPPFQLADAREVFVTASIGVCRDVTGLDAEEAARRADIAMYEAKRAGKDQAIAFAGEMLDSAPERLTLESDFRRALERDEFTVVYQPKVGLRSGVTESLEALVRWIHPDKGFIGPDLFIPFAEESGLVAELGKQILHKACADAVRWQDSGVVVAVNLSPIQFRNPRLVDEVKEALEVSGLRPASLELEITESAVLGDIANTIRVLDELKALGVRLAIDDFGTGYSNLAHLKHFNVDVLKIDQAFVRGGKPASLEHLSDGRIVEAVIGMAKAFGMHVVAEGVETENHADELRALGADLGQGYYFSKPVDGAAIDELIAQERSGVGVA